MIEKEAREMERGTETGQREKVRGLNIFLELNNDAIFYYCLLYKVANL